MEEPAQIAMKNGIRQELESMAEFSKSYNLLDKEMPSEFAQRICTVVEAVLIHELRDAFFIRGSRYSKRPMPNFWPFLSKFTHPSIKKQISALDQIRTEVGKARAWIRIVIGEHSLEHYVNLFSVDIQIGKFYKKSAFIRDLECVNCLNEFLKKLHQVTISLPINSNILNNWTPSPLVLAGLLAGKSTNYSAKKPHLIGVNNLTENVGTDFSGTETTLAQSPEIATNAVMLLLSPPFSNSSIYNYEIASSSHSEQHFEAEQTNNPLTPFLVQPLENFEQQCADNNTTTTTSVVDDNESVLSHPSMLQFEDDSLVTLPLRVPRSISEWKRCGATAASQLRRSLPNAIGAVADSSGRAEYCLSVETAVECDDGSRRDDKLRVPAVEHTSEVVVHRRKTNRRRTTSKGSSFGACSDTGGDDSGHISVCSRNPSANKLAMSPPKQGEGAQFLEQTSSSAKRNEVFGTEMPIPTMLFQQKLLQEMEIPPLGSSLKDELILAEERMLDETKKQQNDNEVFEGEEREESTNQNQKLFKSTQESSELVPYMFNVEYSDSTGSSTMDLPSTFDEALRAFFQKEKDNGISQITASDSNNLWLSSEHPRVYKSQQTSQNVSSPFLRIRSISSLSSDINLLSSDVYAVHNSSTTISSSISKELTSSYHTLSPSNELPNIHLKKVVYDSDNEETGRAGKKEELVEIPPFSKQKAATAAAPQDLLLFTGFNKLSPSCSTSTVSPYKLQKRYLRLIKIAVEQGLDAQDFRCRSCRRNIGGGLGQFKECALSGRYHCEECFRDGGDFLIPARAIFNADFRPRPVSKSSKALLQSIMDRPLFRVDFLNPNLYEHSKKMRKIRDLRRKLGSSVMYLLSCKNTVANDIRRRLWPHSHLHSDLHAYSLMDLECVANGTLERRLNSLIAIALSHIRECPLCMQKGFFCELCSSDRPIYPFQIESVYQCPQCSACFHHECACKFGLLVETEREEGGEGLNVKNSQNSRASEKSSQSDNEPRCCPKCLRRARLATFSPPPQLGAATPFFVGVVPSR